ncbi:hypothetical protein F8388_018438 [Cannabis sativa]|uniref:EF-hand domain-containing protein n=1 Tax=Cannabis sativa TaxID=3483 RepID=A0A7J6F231_CANSA|nr:hypothetical protein F8388_018438 [Cannabis sativa]
MDDEKQKNSSKYAMDLFDAVAARRHITRLSINKAELYEFWEQITDENFDSRLQTFFDMVDKDYDGRINKEDVKNIIKLSANANKGYYPHYGPPGTFSATHPPPGFVSNQNNGQARGYQPGRGNMLRPNMH